MVRQVCIPVGCVLAANTDGYVWKGGSTYPMALWEGRPLGHRQTTLKSLPCNDLVSGRYYGLAHPPWLLLKIRYDTSGHANVEEELLPCFRLLIYG